MNPAEAYIPIDRRLAIGATEELAHNRQGTVLFVDISGFTPFTGALVHHYGPRRGAEELTRLLNQVYSALIAEIDKYQGSVIGFSGDAITCWFDATDRSTQTATRRAIAAALAVQQAMSLFRSLQIGPTAQEAHQREAKEQTFSLAVKTAIAAGAVRRFTVGVPQIQLIDVLAGTTLDRMAATEAMARKNELVIDEESLQPLLEFVTIQEWRTDHNHCRYAVVQAGQHLPEPEPWPACPSLTTTAVQSWVLPAIAARIAGDQGRFLAELRPAAALFLRFTGLDFDHDPDSPAKLDRYIQWAQTIIDQQEGALIQLTTGDKGSYLYATFGAPLAHDNDIERAVAAALALRTPPAACPYIRTTQIGITYGMMRVGAYGGETRKTYGVLGPETNMAARLMVHAAPGQIVVSQIVAEAMNRRYEIAPLGTHLLKGKAEPQPLYAIEQSKMMTLGQPRLYEARLVGRDNEMAILQTVGQQLATRNRAETSAGKIVRIVGAAGLGKSHLIATFVDKATTMGMRFILAGGQSTAQGTAYFVLRQLMQKLLNLDFIQTDQNVSQQKNSYSKQLEGRLTQANANWALRMPLLGDLLGIPIPDNATTSAFDARLRQEALTTLVVEIIQHFAWDERLLLVLEDIHWLDEASQGIILTLSHAIATIPLMLVLVHRPSTRENDRFFTELEMIAGQEILSLEELPADGVMALVEERLAGPIAPLAAELIQAQAQGNPFFTEELVDTLVENAQLQQESGVWRLAPTLINRLRGAGCLVRQKGIEVLKADASLSSVDLGIPNTIQGIILSRLDRLPEPVKLTVKVASVIGRIFDQALLLQAHPLATAQEKLEAEVSTLLARDFAKLEAPAPQLSYIFKHNLTQEVVYQTLLSEQRQELHLGVATALETSRPEQIEALANHYYNSNLSLPPLRDKALHYLEAAGQRAKYDYANETALAYFDRALAIDERVTWLAAKTEILHILGRREEEAALLLYFAERFASARALPALRANYHKAIGEYKKAEEAIYQLMDEAEADHNTEEWLHGQIQLADILVRQGDYNRASAQYRVLLTTIKTARDKSAQSLLAAEAAARYGLGIIERDRGELENALSELERTLSLQRMLHNQAEEARTLTSIGFVHYGRRKFKEAREACVEALEIRRRIGDRSGEGDTLGSLAQIITGEGDFGAAEELLLAAVKIQQLVNNRWSEAAVWNALGILYMMTGQWNRARESLAQGLALGDELHSQSIRAYLLCNLGQIHRDQKHFLAAQQAFDEGLAIAEAQQYSHLTALYLSELAILAYQQKHFFLALNYSKRAEALFVDLEKPLEQITEQSMLALIHLANHEEQQAHQLALCAMTGLNKYQGIGMDYPQRDYYRCYEVFEALDESDLAQASLACANRILVEKANAISNAELRYTFLHAVSHNQAILDQFTR